MLDDVALMLRGRPAGDNGDNIAGSERGVGVVDEVVLGVGKPLVDNLIPLLTSNSDLDGLFHEASRDDDAMKLVRHAARGFGDLRRHGLKDPCIE